MESSARSVSSPEKAFWCAQRLRTSRNLVDEAALGLAQGAAEDGAPVAVHDDQQHGDVLQRILAATEAGVAQGLLDLSDPVRPVERLHLALDEGAQASLSSRGPCRRVRGW